MHASLSIFRLFLASLILCLYIPLAAQQSRTVEDGGTGDYPAIMLSEPDLATHTVFRPADLEAFGEDQKLPVIAWGNGACANSPWEHVNFLSEIASHGFLVVAIGPMPGEDDKRREKSASSLLTDAIDWAIAANEDPESPYYGKVKLDRISVSGMSCGGLQTLEIAPDPRVTTAVIYNSGILPSPNGGMPGMPALEKSQLEKLHTPTLYMLGGESDIAYNNGMDDYGRIDHVPVVMTNLDVGHGGTYGQPHGGEFARVALAWYRWHLLDDTASADMFLGEDGLQADPDWTVEAKGWE
ncbi:hypothetical protein [Lewinella sp. IMCC34191]|uniref:poly(ethylene terephthalate) hydrolase family protein n=1 Tax=Lewinella sp. IMCC34191 TaxID=2259172 RepID=UPI0018E57EF3|nr:hypothetical protein [Lewinella sp. IMCC34191]